MWISLLSGCKLFNDKKLAQTVYNEIEKRYGEYIRDTEIEKTDITE